jgi:arylsulfatase A-like enzyme
MPLHLEDHLDEAVVVGSAVPQDLREAVEWNFDEPQPDWKATPPRPFPAEIRAAEVSQTDDGLRVSLGPDQGNPNERPVGGFYVDVPDWDHRDWAHVILRARSSGPGWIDVAFNLWDQDGHPEEGWPYPYEKGGESTRLVGDSTVQTYQIAMEPLDPWEEPIEQFGFWMGCPPDEPLTLEILSITVAPMDALYAEEPAGIRHDERSNRYRRSLFVHTPAQIRYRVRVPDGGRLDTGLGTLWSDPPTTFRITVEANGGEPETLLEETHGDNQVWAQHSVDLAAFAGQAVTLSLEADSEREGSIALWGAPTLAGVRATEKPNVIFYIIDGAGAEYMSLYGYNRITTPNIDRLAAEGTVFEWAYSNSSWTRPSTASFMTSLQHSVLGGERNGFNVVPDNALTMAEHMHAGGYHTGVFVANPNAGKLSGLQRGVDMHREDWLAFSYFDEGNHQESSKYLHEGFWEWREAYPGEPFWAHFQTVDIHGDFPAVAPFGGLFVSAEEFGAWEAAQEPLGEAEGNPWTGIFEAAEVDRVAYFMTMQGMYDEAMAYNDYQLGRFVERLKAEGEWENTLLVIGADHSIGAAVADLGMFVQDSLTPAWNMPYIRPSISRIPLIFVWPGHIEEGQWFSEPMVSMLDALPTILDLIGLPLPEIMQGQSLAPLLLGQGEVEDRPVVLDQFWVDPETNEFRGVLEVIDGRWGASLEINPEPPEEDEDEFAAMRRRPVPLLLYDLWNDPMCLHSIHEERPDLVEKYTAFLEEQWEAHLALGQYFTPGKDVVLTPEQLEMLRTLGYIR